MWQASLDQWLERLHKFPSYKPVENEFRAALNEVKKLSDDAETIVRILEGIQYYTHIEERYWDPDSAKPDSGPTNIYFEGAQARQVHQSPDDPTKINTDEMSP